MAEPKKKLSKTRTRSRRHQIKLSNPALDYCPQCHEPKLRHQVCKSCGTYKGKKVLDTDDHIAKLNSDDHIAKEEDH